MFDEQRVRLAARLYETRDGMRRLYGDAYAAKVAEIRPYIEKIMEARGLDELKAAMELAKETPGPVVGLILATAVEMVEEEEAARAGRK